MEASETSDDEESEDDDVDEDFEGEVKFNGEEGGGLMRELRESTTERRMSNSSRPSWK